MVFNLPIVANLKSFSIKMFVLIIEGLLYNIKKSLSNKKFMFSISVESRYL